MLQDFTQAQPPVSTLLPRPQRETPKWEPPPSPSLKINFDGAVFRDKDEAGLGVVVRDSHGKVIASLVEKIQLPSSSDEVEALAAVRAITLTMDLNLPSFIVKGDSEVVIFALRKEEESFSSFGHLILSAKHYLHFCNCISFSHIRRSGVKGPILDAGPWACPRRHIRLRMVNYEKDTWPQSSQGFGQHLNREELSEEDYLFGIIKEKDKMYTLALNTLFFRILLIDLASWLQLIL
ncbi:hypothetical protein SO802_017368 [Lithocarpus litseifolius]|uniref:RNase H type-1 domain-containing protein n=1 Tax=Lithocarpus litseifolius TaxID=425828 RepID=A0AAW2CL40_9ROSI